MYGYSEYVSEQDILKRVSQARIFELVFDFLPVEDVFITSPFREDNSPGCYFSSDNQGKLFFVDYGDPNRIKRDCITAVKDFYELSYSETLEFINSKLKVTSLIENPSLVAYQSLLHPKPKRKSSIMTTIKNFTVLDLEYWLTYGITMPNLNEDGVHSIRMYRYYSSKSKKWFTVMPKGRCFSLGNFQERTKLYTPFAKGTERKWLSVCTSNDLWGMKFLPDGGKDLIITKSYKDYRVLKNLGFNVIATQSENMFPSIELLYNLTKRFGHIHIFFDNDTAGIAGSENFIKLIDSLMPFKTFEMILPNIYNRSKDPSDFYKHFGEQELVKFVNTKLLK